MATERDHAGVVGPPPLIFLTALGLGFVVEALIGSDVPEAVRWPAGGLLLFGGLALDASFIRQFARAGTRTEPWKPTTAIVTTGVYRFSRNPAYVGMALVFAGIALLADALWPLATLPVALLVIDRGVIAREERYLTRKFGDEYTAYRARVRRWI